MHTVVFVGKEGNEVSQKVLSEFLGMEKSWNMQAISQAKNSSGVGFGLIKHNKEDITVKFISDKELFSATIAKHFSQEVVVVKLSDVADWQLRLIKENANLKLVHQLKDFETLVFFHLKMNLRKCAKSDYWHRSKLVIHLLRKFITAWLPVIYYMPTSRLPNFANTKKGFLSYVINLMRL